MTDGSRDVRRPAQDIALPVHERRYDFLSGCGFRAFGGNEGHGRGFAALRVGRPSEAKCEIASTLAQTFALVVILTLVFGAVLVPCAFADALVYDDGGRVWGPNIVNSSTPNQPLYGQIIVANNKYNAALFALGYDPNDNDKFTAEVKAKLSNESTGGAFYTFASRFFTVRTFGDIPWQTSRIDFIGLYGTLATLYDVDRIFAVDYDSGMQLAAKISLEVVLNGGGTSGGGPAEFPSVLEVDHCAGQYISAGGGINSRYDFKVSTTTASVRAGSTSLESYIRSNYPDYKYLYCVMMCNYFQSGSSWYYTTGSCQLLLSNSMLTFNSAPTTLNGYSCHTLTVTGGEFVVLNYNGETNTSYISSSRFYVVPSSVSQNSVRTTYTYSGFGQAWRASPYVLIDEPTIPETNWPEPDGPLPEPEPPEVPDVPDEQPITQPNPTNPTVPQQPTDVVGGTPPQYDPVTYPTEQTHTADLQGILDAMAEHCRHLQAAIHTMGDDLGTYLGTIVTQQVTRLHDMVYDNFAWLGGLITGEGSSIRTTFHSDVGWLGGTITDEFYSLKTYLNDLFTWLGEQLNFTVDIQNDSYDDSSVLYWLKRIWSKMGDGISTRPVDPVVDPIGIGDWLGSLWDNFIADLLGVGATLLASVQDDLENLVDKLPFSIPWDIAALLALFVAEPVTPVVTIPWSTVGAGGSLVSSNIVVDLEPYEGAAALIRHMETLVFIGYLLFRFKDDLAVVGGIIDA